MKIELLHDYRGVLTGERYYVAGDYDVPDEMPERDAIALMNAGHAVEVEVGDRWAGLSDDDLRAAALEAGVHVTWNMKRETIIERLEAL